MPGLESVSGTLSRTGSGPIQVKLPPGKDLTPWITSPELQLGPGDLIRVLSYSGANCADLAQVPTLLDIPIVAVRPNGFDLQPVDPGFDPDPACFPAVAPFVGVTLGVLAGNSTVGAWTVLEDLNVLGRLPHGGQFVLTGPRFDYPLDFDPMQGANFPPSSFAYSFSIVGPEPTVAGTAFDFSTADGHTVSSIKDLSPAGNPGFAGPILVYDSTRNPSDQIIFTAVTGSNSVMKAIPAQLGIPNANAFFMYY